MADATMQARVVRILLEPRSKTGLFYAKSPDLKGFLVAETSAEERERIIPIAISEMYAACGVDVVVTELDASDDESQRGYVAMRTEVARRALERRAG